jgi:hypothetical protein
MICRAIAEAARRVKNLPAARTPPLTTHLSWDIDSAGMFRHGAARGSVRRVLSERTAGEALRTALRACAFFLGIGSDPHDNLDEIGDRLGEAGVRCMFFVQAVRAHRLDDYGLRHAPQLVRAVRRLRERGHTIGLHSSYATIERETDFLRHQRRIAMRLVGGEMTHHRSHYLRTGSRADWKRLAHAGIRTDWTPGFSEREGFRLGTAHPVTPWDERAEKPLPLTVIPLTAMDVTLRYHRKFTPQEATQRIEDLKKECRIAGGEFTLLWHPHNLEPTLWWGWKDVAFEENHEWHE